MKTYATLYFEKSPVCDKDYILLAQNGTIKGLDFSVYAKNEKNNAAGVSDKKYMRFMVPRRESMRKYFAYTFEMKPNVPITSVEPLDEKKRTFGDAKKIGLNDLILFRFSDDMSRLIMEFVKDKGISKAVKQRAFQEWTAELDSGE